MMYNILEGKLDISISFRTKLLNNILVVYYHYYYDIDKFVNENLLF